MRLFNVPQVIQQPSGETVQCFASGDEQYNWLHDQNGYIIIQDSKTGAYMYAQYKNGSLQSSELIVTSDTICDSLLKTKYFFVVKIDDLRDQVLEKSSPYKMDILQKQEVILSGQNAVSIAASPTTGTINNIVIFVRFQGEAEYAVPLTTYNNMFNNTTAYYNSVYNYFQATSYNQLTLFSRFFVQGSGDTIISYEDAQVRGYYKPYSVTNTLGYQTDAERTTREQTLVANAILYAKPLVDAAPYSVDSDGDGLVDSIVLIVKGMPEGWSDLLWPHQWVLFEQTVLLQGARAWNYNFQLSDFLTVGTLCHELLHTLGYPDLYHYNFDGLDPVGIWDIMDITTNPPQNNNAYTKYRYGKWIQSLPVITTCGNYSLNPLTLPNNNVWRINTPYATTEYFVLEYRKKEAYMDSTLPGSGLLVYRINTAVDGQGNADGPPDEVYLFRPGGTVNTNGTLNNAYLTSDVGRTSIGGSAQPLFLSDGTDSGIIIQNIGSAGSTISFNVQLVDCGLITLQIQKQALPSMVNRGDTVTYQIVVTNTGSLPLQNINLSDVLPPELQDPMYSIVGTSDWYPWSGSYEITALAAGGAITLLIRGVMQFLGRYEVPNTAVISLDGQEKMSSATVSINKAVDSLQVTKTASATIIGINQELTYQITVSNTGPVAIQNIYIVDGVPLEVNNPMYLIQGDSVWRQWNGSYLIGSLASGQSVTLFIKGKIEYLGRDTIVNTAILRVGGQQKTSSVAVTINRNLTSLHMIKYACPNPVIVGQELTYAIEISNKGTVALQNIVITDPIPPEIQSPMYMLKGETTWYLWSGSYVIMRLAAGETTTILIKGTVQYLDSSQVINTVTARAESQQGTARVTVRLIKPVTCYVECNGSCQGIGSMQGR